MSRPRVPKELRDEVARQAHFCCEFCLSQQRVSSSPLCVEHIIPRVHGGADDLTNFGLACAGCNGSKGIALTGRDPATERFMRLYHPRRDRWREHFAWSDDSTLLIGLSPIGRATIERLRLNRSGVVELRIALLATGKHPPAHTL